MEANILDDYEHSVTNKIDKYKENADFPKPEDYAITSEELSDYLFDKQVLIDSLGTEKSQYTRGGIIAVIPVLVVSAIPEQNLPGGLTWSGILAVVIGVALALLEALIERLVRKIRIRKMRNEQIEKYIAAVFAYDARQSNQA